MKTFLDVKLKPDKNPVYFRSANFPETAQNRVIFTDKTTYIYQPWHS